jgi:hypothetical protein
MLYHPSPAFPRIEESPSPYSPTPWSNPVYEISLRTAHSSDWLRDLPGAHRLVQGLFQGELLGRYELLDFLIWPEGLLTRVSLKGASSLSEFLVFLREKSTPSGEAYANFWDDELQWIKLVPLERLPESTRAFLQTADRIRREVQLSRGFSPNLFFFYRNSRLTS